MKLLKISVVSVVLCSAILILFLRHSGVEERNESHADVLKSRAEGAGGESPGRKIQGKYHSRDLDSPSQFSEGARKARAETERMRDAGMLAKKGAPNYVMIGQNGRITNQAILQTGVSEEQVAEMQSVIDRYWIQMTDSLADRAILVEEDSDPERGLFAFVIPALADGGMEAVRGFEADIRHITGERTGTILLRSFAPGSYVGGFGKFEIRMKVSANPSGERITEFEFRHPGTGFTVRKGRLSQNYSYQYFGDLLENSKFQTIFKRAEN